MTTLQRILKTMSEEKLEVMKEDAKLTLQAIEYYPKNLRESHQELYDQTKAELNEIGDEIVKRTFSF